MSTALQPVTEITPIERALVMNDLSKLSEAERGAYYREVCDSLGLNHLTQPFGYLHLSGKLTLYPKRDATDQLRKLHGVSVQIVGRDRLDDLYIVTAEARTPDGRIDSSTGVVSLAGLKGEALANALMKAETKAKRRVTLSICGLGLLDESEIATVPGAQVVSADWRPAQLPQPSDPDAEPRPDAELVRYMEDGVPIWRVAGVECIRAKQGKYLISLDPCPEHDQPFAILLDGGDSDWRHGKGEARCRLREVLAAPTGVASSFEGAFE